MAWCASVMLAVNKAVMAELDVRDFLNTMFTKSRVMAKSRVVWFFSRIGGQGAILVVLKNHSPCFSNWILRKSSFSWALQFYKFSARWNKNLHRSL
jgi:hypothetical protein